MKSVAILAALVGSSSAFVSQVNALPSLGGSRNSYFLMKQNLHIGVLLYSTL
jgi:hypothetical protein